MIIWINLLNDDDGINGGNSGGSLNEILTICDH